MIVINPIILYEFLVIFDSFYYGKCGPLYLIWYLTCFESDWILVIINHITSCGDLPNFDFVFNVVMITHFILYGNLTSSFMFVQCTI